MTISRQGALEALLRMMFSDDELRSFFRRLPDTEPLLVGLPGDATSPFKVVLAAIGLLERNGVIDGNFFAALVEIRPRQRPKIEEVATMWGVTLPESISSSVRASARTDPREFAAPSSSPATTSRVSRSEQLRKHATIGILTALPEELAAIRVMLESPVRWTARDEGSGTSYYLGEIPSNQGGGHAVAVGLLPDMGNNAAALSAQALLHHFPGVQHLIMCGIAGGVPRMGDTEHDVRLGDIVVSNRNGVVQYDMVKLASGKAPEHRHPPRPPGRELLDAVRLLESGALLDEHPWEAFLDRSVKVKNAARPVDYLDARGLPIEYPDDPERKAGSPRVFSGTVAASNALLKDPTIRDRLGRDFGVKAIEMEGSGVADASWYSDRAGYLVVRGICDYCDGNKGDTWRGYAAVAAAAYVRALLESMATAGVTRRTSEAEADGGIYGPDSGNEPLHVDDVIVNKGAGCIVLDVRVRNSGNSIVNITRADLHVLSRIPAMAVYKESASYDLLLDAEHNEIPIAHVLRPGDVDKFSIVVGFSPFNTSCFFEAEIILRYNNGRFTASDRIRFSSCFTE